MWYWINVGYACGGIKVENDIVVETAPIYRWMKRNNWSDVKKWRKIKEIRVLRKEDDNKNRDTIT